MLWVCTMFWDSEDNQETESKLKFFHLNQSRGPQSWIINLYSGHKFNKLVFIVSQHR